MSKEALKWLADIRDSLSLAKRQTNMIAKSLEAISFTLGTIDEKLNESLGKERKQDGP